MTKQYDLKDSTIIAIRKVALDRLIPSKDNVRREYSKKSIVRLAANIAAHRLLQNLTVTPERTETGAETGRYEVTAGGRRLRALNYLAEKKRIARDAPIPCNVRSDETVGISLSENVEREALHPADEFEGFLRLQKTDGLSAKDIAGRFGVSERHVRERLKLAAVSPKLLALYRKGAMSLEHVMAFTVSGDHARQEALWTDSAFPPSPYAIRKALLEGHVRADDRRAKLVGLSDYKAAGGTVVRDLFDDDNGGYLADIALLERLARARLEETAAPIRAEGWKWVETVIDIPHGHGLERVYARSLALSEAKAKRLDELEAELEALEADASEDDAASAERWTALHREYEALEAEARVFDPSDIARAGVFVGIGPDGTPEVVRGLVRPEDGVEDCEADGDISETDASPAKSALSDRLTANLTAYRTLALRATLSTTPDVALIAVTHALALKLFYTGAQASCLEIGIRCEDVDRFAPEAQALPFVRELTARHEAWAGKLPRDADVLWPCLLRMGDAERRALLAHCAALSVFAVEQRAGRSRDDHLALSQTLGLDMRAHWKPTAASYFRHVSKHAILAAVCEGASEQAAARLESLKKAEMADAAEVLLRDSGWLPEPLRLMSPVAADETPLGTEQSAAE
ncbi:MAG: ParB/RepB/Spo0J family partition protein [Reyranella sp.]|nr:ParB/RepB/Spo0J family partition protein [Reyranella sp.]MBL6851926.1 ParB/RepB/Spo0J family partition protein [Alphaproteobacteria bacterium]